MMLGNPHRQISVVFRCRLLSGVHSVKVSELPSSDLLIALHVIGIIQ